MDEQFRIIIEAALNKQKADADLKTTLKELQAYADAKGVKVNLSVSDAKKLKELQSGIQKTASLANAFSKQRYSNTMQNWLERNTKAVGLFGEQLNRLQAELNDPNLTNPNFTKIKTEFETIKRAATEVGVTGQTFKDKFKFATDSFSTWITASTFIMQTVRSIKLMVDNVIQLDSAMVELKKVTDETSASYDNFLRKTAPRIAKNTGATVKDTVNATADYSRLGFKFDESAELAEIATTYKTVGDLESIDTATEHLISTLKGFNIEANNAREVIDILNEVSNNYAISAGGIGTALQDSAAALNIAGNSIEQSVAMIVSGNAAIQDPAEVGTSLKIVSLRLRNMKGELEELGEEVSDDIDSISKLQTQILNLTAVDDKGGVNIFDQSGNFRETYDILNDIAKIWDKLSSTDQAQLLELIAGKHRANVVASMLTNWQDATDAYQTALNSEGSANKELEKYLDSINAKMNQFKATAEAMSIQILDSQFLKAAVDGGTKLFEVFNGLTEIFGSLPTLISIASAAMTAFGKNAGRAMKSLTWISIRCPLFSMPAYC